MDQPESTTSPTQGAIPRPVRTESRSAFGLAWFHSEAEAAAYAAARQGRENGGLGHGLPTGRAPGWDYDDAAGRLYAVTEP